MHDNERLFGELAEALGAEPGVAEGTMMGSRCLRVNGDFFAMVHRHSHQLIVKLSPEHIDQLVNDGKAERFAPSGRVFREWAAVVGGDRRRWQTLLAEALRFVGGRD